MTRIVVDAMGSDNFPTPDVEGAVMAAREYGVEIILVGDASKIQPVLDSANAGNLPIGVIDAPEMLTMHDKGEDLVMKARLPSRGEPRSDSYEGDGYVVVRDPDTEVVKAAVKTIIETISIEYG